MKLNEMFPSKYISADDLEGEDRVVSISKISIERMKTKEGGEEEKPVIWFRNVDKGMVLNRTNADRITAQHGDETDNWVGKQVTLTTESVTAFGETKWAVRVKAVPPKPTGAAKSAFAKPAAAATPAGAFGGDEPEVTP